MSKRNEVFESIKVSGLTFENPVSDTFDALTAGQYPSQNSVLMITDTKGTAQFSRNIDVDTVTVQNITADVGTFTDLSATTGSFGNLTATNISVDSVISSGPITTRQLQLGAGTLTLDASGTPLWNGQSLIGWQPLLAPTTTIPLLGPTATAAEIADTVNTLLTVLKNKGIVIS
jgi:hypothetical protein